MLRPEPAAQPAETANHLVGNQQDVVGCKDRLNAFEIAPRRRNHAARPHKGFGNERRDGVGSFPGDQRLEFSAQPIAEFLFTLAGLGVAIVMRRRGKENALHGKVEGGVKGG